MYNITNITDANNAYDIIKATSDLSGGLLFAFIMPLLFFIILVVFHRRDFKKVLVGDSFFMVILGALGHGLDFVGWSYVIVPLVLFLGTLIAYMFMD